MTPKVKIFQNIFPDSSTGHRITFRDQIWWKSTVAKLPKGRLDYHTKKLGLRGTCPSPPFCPKWADRAQNSLNVVIPWHVHVCRIWSGSTALCRTYSGKIDFSDPKSKAFSYIQWQKIINVRTFKHKRDQCFIHTHPRGVLPPQGPGHPLDGPLHSPLLAGCIMHALNNFIYLSHFSTDFARFDVSFEFVHWLVLLSTSYLTSHSDIAVVRMNEHVFCSLAGDLTQHSPAVKLYCPVTVLLAIRCFALFTFPNFA